MTQPKKINWTKMPDSHKAVAAHAGRASPFALTDEQASHGLEKLDVSALAVAREALLHYADSAKQLRSSIHAARKALHWMGAADSDAPLAFATVCADLGMDEDAMRTALLQNIPAAYLCALRGDTDFACPLIPNRTCGQPVAVSPFNQDDTA